MKKKPIKSPRNINILGNIFFSIGTVVLAIVVIIAFRYDIAKNNVAQAETINELTFIQDASGPGHIVSYIMTDTKTEKQYILLYNTYKGTVFVVERDDIDE